MVVGHGARAGERVLLCKRNIEPRWGKWTLPAGFMELGETAEQGAARETDEEAGALITMGPLFSLLSVPQVGAGAYLLPGDGAQRALRPRPRDAGGAALCRGRNPLGRDRLSDRQAHAECFFADRRGGRVGVHSYDIL